MGETRVDVASRGGPSPLAVMLLPFGLLLVIGIAAWAMFANPVPGAPRAGASPNAIPSQSSTPLPEPSYTDNGSMNVSALIAEYQRAAAGLEGQLPEGYHYPEGLPAPVDLDLMSPPGSGEYEALVFWRCAWTAQFLTDFDAEDQSAIDHDLDTLDSWLDHAVVTDGDEDGSQAAVWRDEVMKPARNGHVGNLRLFGLGPCRPVPTRDEPIEVEPALELEWTLTQAS